MNIDKAYRALCQRRVMALGDLAREAGAEIPGNDIFALAIGLEERGARQIESGRGLGTRFMATENG